MRDYDSTVKNLREAAKGLLFDAMPYRASVMRDAADAIDELLTERDNYKAYFDNVSSLPDCNVCLKQGVCEFVPAYGENTRINCPLALTEPPKEVE